MIQQIKSIINNQPYASGSIAAVDLNFAAGKGGIAPNSAM
jgi:hypothetical protein